MLENNSVQSNLVLGWPTSRLRRLFLECWATVGPPRSGVYICSCQWNKQQLQSFVSDYFHFTLQHVIIALQRRKRQFPRRGDYGRNYPPTSRRTSRRNPVQMASRLGGSISTGKPTKLLSLPLSHQPSSSLFLLSPNHHGKANQALEVG